MAWSTAATSAATGRASGKFATAPRPSAISFSPACLSIAPSSQCSSVTEPAAFAALAAASRAGSSAARSGSDRNILMLACPRLGEGGDLAFWQRGGVQEDRVEEPVDRGLRRGAGHLPGDRGARRLLRAVVVRHRVGHVADRRDAAGDRGPRAGPEVVHPDREPEPVAKPLVHEVRVRVDPAGNREQAVGGELLRARHRAAELGDPAVGDADVSDFPVTGRDHGRAAYNEVKAHRSIVAGGYQTAARRVGPAAPVVHADTGGLTRLTASSSSFAATVAPSVRIVPATALARARVWGVRAVLSAADRDSVVGA